MVKVPIYASTLVPGSVELDAPPAAAADDDAVRPATRAVPNPRATGRETAAVALSVHALASRDGLHVRVRPPAEPAAAVSHVPCDIVLVVDVSGSMGQDAPVPGGGADQERNGLSILDLTKHAAQTIIETLNHTDRLAIVTFDLDARVIQPLTRMDAKSKRAARNNVRAMALGTATNLWGGIKLGMDQFVGEKHTGRVPAIMVLTDGQPNHQCPRMGYIPALRQRSPFPATIHTFGFGYDLRSGLLKSIAEYTGGKYAFIPDAGMIGTVFVHAVANLQATFATHAVLTLSYPRASISLRSAAGPVAGHSAEQADGDLARLTIPLGNIQYGQSRDVLLAYDARDLRLAPLLLLPDVARAAAEARSAEYSAIVPVVDARLEFRRMTSAVHALEARRGILDFDDANANTSTPAPGPAETAFHRSRAAACAFLSGLFPLKRRAFPHSEMADEDEREQPTEAMRLAAAERLPGLVESLPAGSFAAAIAAATAQAGGLTAPAVTQPVAQLDLLDDTEVFFARACAALLADLTGQVALALSSADYLNRWGRHYLSSLHTAHHDQVCNSFKDPGPQVYGAHSPLFLSCRAALDAAFETLPPPEPSNMPSTMYAHMYGPGAAASPPSPTTTTAGSRSSSAAAARHRRRRSAGSTSSASSRSRSRPTSSGAGGQHRARIDMRAYHDAGGSCFHGSTPVAVIVAAAADNEGRAIATTMRFQPLATVVPGRDAVLTPRGPRKVAAALWSRVPAADLVDLGGGVLATRWHPVKKAAAGASAAGGEEEHAGEWVFPADVQHGTTFNKVADHPADDDDGTATVISLLLERDGDAAAHAIALGSGAGRSEDSDVAVPLWWGVTLGHGLLPDNGGVTAEAKKAGGNNTKDVREHAFFGDYDAVERALQALQRGVGASQLLFFADAVRRDDVSGLVVGFEPRPEEGRADENVPPRDWAVGRPLVELS